ncbi:helicase-exonuclease AddAB subunit AddA [Rossellomorea aquimaris]|nr:helicase-exonuclease AddAB subunit AddA [Rossellomorea aquimaris]
MSSATTIEDKQTKWTKEQSQAIYESGKDILVAAAAGSGKTAVLVERMIKKVTSPDRSVDVDRLLVVTFTNAAAAEMRKRIGEALEKEISKNPSSRYLKKQLTLLTRASISTLHSFCINIARKYYYELGIDPRFRVVDETESELIREEVIEELFEEEYSLNNEEFLRVADWYSQDRHDTDLQMLVRKLYDFSRAYPWPDEWLESLVGNYQTVDPDESVWIKELLEDVKLQIMGCRSLLEKGMQLTRQPNGPYPYAENLIADIKYVDDLRSAQSWEELYDAFQVKGFGNLKRVPKDEVDPVIQDQVKGLRNEVKKQINKMKEEMFSKTLGAYMEDIKDMEPVVRVLVDLTKKYSQKFWEKKQEKALVDFSDLEHLALKLLYNEGKPSNAAIELQNFYDEVLVDEYQDINLVQETILKLVSSGDNMFMVGDVKQSIYRFRLAEPALFLDKYRRFKGDGSGERIDLAKNFRSRKQVLEGTNFIFRQIMNESVGDIEYDEAAELKLGAGFDKESVPVDVVMINRNGESDPEDISTLTASGVSTAELEGKLLARKIKDMILSQYKVIDKETGKKRNVNYRDIVILMRSFSSASTIMEELKKQGVPSYAELSSGYFEAIEVQVMMSLLKVVDNPYQDIPLAAVLRSPFMSMTEEELAQIRAQHKKGPFFDALVMYPKANKGMLAKRIVTFLKQLGKWRDSARDGALAELIWSIYRETKYFEFVGGMNGGKQRQANLLALYDRAKQYESTSFRGLFRFLRFIERMQERGDDLGAARALGEQEDVVRLMTIHKSKGLEFPVVFVAGMNKEFNQRDMKERVLLHKEMGYGSRFINTDLRVSYNTLPHLAIKKRMHKEMIAEEMRVLYVALTRAKEKLFLLGTIKDVEKSMDTWKRHLTHQEWILPDYERLKAKSYFDWVGPAVMRHSDAVELNESKTDAVPVRILEDPSEWKIEIVEGVSLVENEVTTVSSLEKRIELLQSIKPVDTDDIYKEEVHARLSWEYQHKDAQYRGSKQSVTEVKRQKEIIEGYNIDMVKQQREPVVERPRFIQKKNLSPAEVGTAMHAVMQQIKLQPEMSASYIKTEVDRMVVQELLTPEQGDAIKIGHISKFFKTRLGKGMLSANTLYREIPFSYSVSSKEAYSDWTDKEERRVLVQGVFDCVYEINGKLVIIDYKTDFVSPQDVENGFERIKRKYKVQMDLYKRAVSEIWNKEVGGIYLYLFNGGYMLGM